MHNMVNLDNQGLTHPNCSAVLYFACMKEFINMNSICLLEAEKNGIKQNNLTINLTTENRLYISGMDGQCG